MKLVSKLYRMADDPSLPREECAEVEVLIAFVVEADRPETLLRLGETALYEGIHQGYPSLVEAGRLLKEEAQRWGEKRTEARQKREEADRRASKFSLGDLLRGAL